MTQRPLEKGSLVRSLVFSILSCFAINSNADTRFSGYLKNFTVLQEDVSNDVFQIDSNYSSQFSARLMAEGFQENLSWQVHYELGSQFNARRQPNFALPIERNPYRLSDIKNQLSDSNSKTSTVQNLDRFNLQLSLDAGDLTIGRQPITFGSARIINPTDVFLPFDVQALNTEYRVGIDAIRFQKPVGQLSELDVGYILSEETDRSALFSRFKTNAVGSDFEFTAIRFSELKLLGVGIQSTLGPFGAWFEVANVSGEDSYNRVSGGLDYGFSESVFGMLEYHYNGAGGDPSEYFTQINQPAYIDGGVFLLGENYLLPSLSWQASALTSYSLQIIANLDDESNFVILGFDRSLTDNLYLGGSVYWFTGDDASLTNIGSEYGNNPNQLILNLRYYF